MTTERRASRRLQERRTSSGARIARTSPCSLRRDEGGSCVAKFACLPRRRVVLQNIRGGLHESDRPRAAAVGAARRSGRLRERDQEIRPPPSSGGRSEEHTSEL